jgi:rRNA-processing protein FCF1
MRYLLDTHSLSNKIVRPSARKNDLYILDEVMEEYAFSKAEVQKVTRAGIKTISLEKKHLEKMKELMSIHGGNLELIRLYTSEGVGDVAMLSYILAERDTPGTLFPEVYTLITKDKELRHIAESYGIKCLDDL